MSSLSSLKYKQAVIEREAATEIDDDEKKRNEKAEKREHKTHQK